MANQAGGPDRAKSGAPRSPRRKGWHLAGKIWIERDGLTFLAWGRVVLLERIRTHGSILAAARSMKMSYRHAWELVEEMNHLALEPLVARKVGGRRGGGSRLTAAGDSVIRNFWKLVRRFESWTKHFDASLERKLRTGR